MENSNENQQHGKKKSLHFGDILFLLVEVALVLVSFNVLLLFYLKN
jgi:hypothetical protein